MFKLEFQGRVKSRLQTCIAQLTSPVGFYVLVGCSTPSRAGCKINVVGHGSLLLQRNLPVPTLGWETPSDGFRPYFSRLNYLDAHCSRWEATRIFFSFWFSMFSILFLFFSLFFSFLILLSFFVIFSFLFFILFFFIFVLHFTFLFSYDFFIL